MSKTAAVSPNSFRIRKVCAYIAFFLLILTLLTMYYEKERFSVLYSDFFDFRQETIVNATEPPQRLVTWRDTANLTFYRTRTTQRTCSPKYNVMFLKTHKTASSTIQNILYRYGLNRNLKFALPVNQHDFGYPGRFRENMIAFKETSPFNIICNHMRFDKDLMAKTMPNNSLYISILREPGSLFESSFDYFYDLVSEFHHVAHRSPTSIEKWLDNADKFFHPDRMSTYGALAKNHMMFDFGYSAAMTNDTMIEKAITEIDNSFDFILISNYMDESLVLLAEMLCCPLTDVTSVVLNARNKKESDMARKKRIREKVRKWNKADAALFDYFNKSLWRKIDEFGVERMKVKVKELQEAKQNQMETCVDGTETKFYSDLKNTPWKDQRIYQPKGVRIAGYDLKPGAEQIDTCVNLIAPESFLSKKVFHAQSKFL